MASTHPRVDLPFFLLIQPDLQMWLTVTGIARTCAKKFTKCFK
jgi:hypothetical protein